MIDNTFAYRKLLGQDPANSFGAISINVASPDVIRSWSHGEVKNPETINYRSLKPEKDGLFCEKIFGPTRDWECNCGKYKRIKHKGIICDRCGVEVTLANVRRERMGHIELAVPVSHIWFFKCMPCRIGLMLEMTSKDLENVLYYEKYVVVDPGDAIELTKCQVLDETQYREAKENYGDSFIAEMGAPAIKALLEDINLEELKGELELRLESTNNKASRKKLAKRLRLVEGFLEAGSRPEYMIMSVLPIIPPDLRPLVPLEGGRFATSDLNDLYRRVINRNNRLKNLLSLNTPEVIIRNEKRMLQEAVDSLMDNGRHGRVVTGAGNRALKSLSDMLKGKQGRFRQNLLGKRVDYSGRSVIVVGPELKIYQCGLPKKMAMVLFEPFIIRHLKGRGYAHTVRGAKRMIERGESVVWDILDEVSKGHPVMLNRAPTLHRLSIQAFDPVLIEGSALRLHPLVCTAYNADFDGDQMAVHVPLSNEAQMETKLLMLSPNNIFSPANGKPIVSPTQDITLGSYYLTLEPQNKSAKLYRDYFEVLFAMQSGFIGIHDAVRIPNPDRGKDTLYGDKESKFILTTPGRCLFNEIWDSRLGFYNQVAKKKDLSRLIRDSYQIVGHQATIKLLDDLKDLGYRHSTLAGLSISIADLKVPATKVELIENARNQIGEVMQQYTDGMLTDGERHKKVIDIWTQTSNTVANELFKHLEDASRRGEINPVYAMMDSGARGSKDQIRQLAGMRGLMAKPNGDIIERPIISNFREGLSVLEYFISTHGARKGLADTALKTADSGYMTRRLVDVAQDIICREEDCGTTKGVWTSAITEGDEVMLPLRDRLVGRYSAQDIRDPAYNDKRLIIAAGEEFTPEIAELIEKRGILKVLIRSALTCETHRGLCIKCYGRNLASDREARLGDALGIIAAQSIGEPGTQLTMRTFHIGGTASAAYKQPVISARHDGKIKLLNVRTVVNQKGQTVVVNKNGCVIIYDPVKANEFEERERAKRDAEAAALGMVPTAYDFGTDAIIEAELERYDLEPGSMLDKVDGEEVKVNEVFVRWEPDHVPIIIEESGVVSLTDLVDGVTIQKQKRGSGNGDQGTVMEHRDDLHPQITVLDENNNLLSSYPLPAGAVLMIKNGAKVVPGMVVARVPRQSAKNKDITGGLPRIAELFEARIPKDVAEIAKIDGFVTVDKLARGKRHIEIRDPNSGRVEEHNAIPLYKHLVVSKGDYVHKGQKLTEGSIVPHALLEVCGIHELQRHLVDEIQLVYRAQGVEINDKHVEIIIRQMMQKVRITDPGDTEYLVGEQPDRVEFNRINRETIARGERPAEAEPVLLGITKAALETESFISAASFQDTTRILTEAAVAGKVDNLVGFKENVITGHLIPAGTGTAKMQSIRLKYLGTEIEPELPAPEAEKSYEDIAAEWRDSDSDEEDMLPDEAKELIVDEDLEGFNEEI